MLDIVIALLSYYPIIRIPEMTFSWWENLFTHHLIILLTEQTHLMRKRCLLSPTFNHNIERSELLIEAVTFLHGVLNIHFANLKLLEKLKTQLQFIFKVFSFQFISPHLLQFTILSFHSFLCFIQIFALISNKI